MLHVEVRFDFSYFLNLIIHENHIQMNITSLSLLNIVNDDLRKLIFFTTVL